jgi:hypothetical protein
MSKYTTKMTKKNIQFKTLNSCVVKLMRRYARVADGQFIYHAEVIVND